MKYLLDVSALIALIWPSHVHHSQVMAWKRGKALAVCPITELGFVRVSTGPAFNASMVDARRAMADFIHDERPEFVPADIRVLDGDPAPTSGKTTEWYLANLARKHGMKWATLDLSAKHPAAVVVT